MCLCHSACVEVRGQFKGSRSLLPYRSPWACGAWWEYLTHGAISLTLTQAVFFPEVLSGDSGVEWQLTGSFLLFLLLISQYFMQGSLFAVQSVSVFLTCLFTHYFVCFCGFTQKVLDPSTLLVICDLFTRPGAPLSSVTSNREEKPWLPFTKLQTPCAFILFSTSGKLLSLISLKASGKWRFLWLPYDFLLLSIHVFLLNLHRRVLQVHATRGLWGDEPQLGLDRWHWPSALGQLSLSLGSMFLNEETPCFLNSASPILSDLT